MCGRMDKQSDESKWTIQQKESRLTSNLSNLEGPGYPAWSEKRQNQAPRTQGQIFLLVNTTGGSRSSNTHSRTVCRGGSPRLPGDTKKQRHHLRTQCSWEAEHTETLWQQNAAAGLSAGSWDGERGETEDRWQSRSGARGEPWWGLPLSSGAERSGHQEHSGRGLGPWAQRQRSGMAASAGAVWGRCAWLRSKSKLCEEARATSVFIAHSCVTRNVNILDENVGLTHYGSVHVSFTDVPYKPIECGRLGLWGWVGVVGGGNGDNCTEQ